MPYRVESSASWVSRQSSKSTISNTSENQSNVTIIVWMLRILLLFILILFIMPIAFLLTPWWIWMQPFQRQCPNLINGYYRIVTWPLTLSEKIRSFRQNHYFIERLKY
jgi:hypothetical protein